MEIPFDFPYFASYPHIPTYLSPKQFVELYWPHYKMTIEKLAAKGNKMLICCEGKWAHLLSFFREVPKDSCILMLDDDDLFETNRAIGDWQLIAGGAKLSRLRMDSRGENLDYAKRAIDECAPGGGFLFGTDRCWISPGDVNQNMIDVFNFAHEYSKK